MIMEYSEKVFRIEDAREKNGDKIRHDSHMTQHERAIENLRDGNNSNPKEEVLVLQDEIKDFGGRVTLVVPFAHEVIVIKDGEMLETLTGGKHVLNDVEPPKKTLFGTKKFISEPHDYQVFYVNNNVTLLCKWGTPNQMKIFDPFLKIPVSVGAFGTFDISVLNSRKFMLKLVGNVEGLTTEGLRKFFADKLVMRVKDVLANAMVTSGINFYELPTKLVAISEAILASIRNIFEDYGVEIVNFSINHIQIPESDTRALEDIIKKKRILEMQDKSFKSEDEARQEAYKLHADTVVKLAENNLILSSITQVHNGLINISNSHASPDLNVITCGSVLNSY